MSYYIKSLFTNVSINETIEYFLEEIYVHNKLPKLCSHLIFHRHLLKLTTGSTYMFNSKVYKQSVRSTISGSSSVTFSNNSCLTKLEIDKFRPTKPLYYKRLVDDVINRSKKNTPDLLLMLLVKLKRLFT